MTENLIILVLFILALGYLGNMFKRNFLSPQEEKSGCAKGCGSRCGQAVDKISSKSSDKG